MDKRKLAPLTAYISKNRIYNGLLLAGIREKSAAKYFTSPIDELELATIFNFAKQIKIEIDKLWRLYNEQPPEFWTALQFYTHRDSLPEMKKLAMLKTTVRKMWYLRPQFREKRLKEKL